MLKTYTVTSRLSGKAYEVRKMRSADSFDLATYHARRAGDVHDPWLSLRVSTLKEAREALHA